MKDAISNNSTNIFSEFFIRSNQLLSISYQFSAQYSETHKLQNTMIAYFITGKIRYMELPP